MVDGGAGHMRPQYHELKGGRTAPLLSGVARRRWTYGDVISNAAILELTHGGFNSNIAVLELNSGGAPRGQRDIVILCATPPAAGLGYHDIVIS